MDISNNLFSQMVEDEEPAILWETYPRDELPLRTSIPPGMAPGVTFVFAGCVEQKDYDGSLARLPAFSVHLVVPHRTSYVFLCAMDGEGAVEVVLNMAVPDHIKGRMQIPRRFMGPSDGWLFHSHPEVIDFLLVFFGEEADLEMIEAFAEYDEMDDSFLLDAFAWSLQDPNTDVTIYTTDVARVFTFAKHAR